jgi:hypothetical protein
MNKALNNLPAQKASPVLVHVTKSKNDISDLIQKSGIPKSRMITFLKNAETPDPFECYMLDQAFRYALGTFLEEYTIWDYGTYQTA